MWIKTENGRLFNSDQISAFRMEKGVGKGYGWIKVDTAQGQEEIYSGMKCEAVYEDIIERLGAGDKVMVIR